MYLCCPIFIILSSISKCCRPPWLACMSGSTQFLSGYNCFRIPVVVVTRVILDWRLCVRYSMGNVCRAEEIVCRPACLHSDTWGGYWLVLAVSKQCWKLWELITCNMVCRSVSAAQASFVLGISEVSFGRKYGRYCIFFCYCSQSWKRTVWTDFLKKLFGLWLRGLK
jgi:hypothetical protein